MGKVKKAYSDKSEQDFSDGWIERQLTKRRTDPSGLHRPEYTDTQCMGLMCWFAKNKRDVTFALRMTVKLEGRHKGKRIYDRIGKWSPGATGLNYKKARTEANARRAKYELEGFAEVKECPLLDEAISGTEKGKEGYEYFRRRRDRRTTRNGKGLPESWPTHVRRFREIYQEFLTQPVSVLDMDTLTRARDQYIDARVTDKEDEDLIAEEMKKIHSTIKTVMPMLRLWFRDTHGWIGRDQQVQLLTPKGYGDNSRYLYPGEWQAAIPAFEQLETECPGAGWFSRFVFATAARPEQALLMKWEDMNWGRWKYLRDAKGDTHEALIWMPPPETMKGRSSDEEDDEKPSRLIVTGMALDILKRLRVIWERNRKANPDSTYTGVFPHEAVQLWKDNRSGTQREIERRSGTGGGKAKWHRKVLRHTHTVYLEFLSCPPRLMTMSLTHVPSQEGAAAVTGVYTGADPVDRFMENDELAELGLWHLKLHQLIRDMEEGNTESPELTAICESLETKQKSARMRERYGVDRKFIQVIPRVKAPRLSVVK